MKKLKKMKAILKKTINNYMTAFVASDSKKRRYSYEGGLSTLRENKFEEALGSLKDMRVSLLLIDHRVIEGLLIDVKQDHIIIDVNHKVYYFSLKHIQAISNNAKEFCVSPHSTPYLNRKYLVEVLIAMRYTWVTINGWSNQEIFGVLSKITEDHILLIKNAELLNIPNSSIATIHSQISEEQIISLNKMEHIAIQQTHPIDISQEEIDNRQLEEQVETLQIVDDHEVVIHVGKIAELESMDTEQPDIEIIEDSNVPELEKGDMPTNSEQPIAISQEQAIQEFLFRMNSEFPMHSITQKVEERQHSQHEEPVAVNDKQPTSIKSIVKSNEHIVIESPEIVEITGTTIKNEHSDVYSELEVVIEDSNLLLLDKCELKNSEDDYWFEENQEEILKCDENGSHDEEFILDKPPYKHNEKRILLSAWGTFHNDQRTNTIQDNLDLESDYLLEEDHSVMAVHDYEQNQNLNQLIMDTNTKVEEIEISDENSIQVPIRRNILEERAMLKMQYYALMTYAAGKFVKLNGCCETSMYSATEERNILPLPISDISLKEQEMLERQYYSLMKYAEKMYQQLKDLEL